jgi:hypothetical protein
VTLLTQVKMGFLVCCLLLVAGCTATKEEPVVAAKDAPVVISGIVVLPVHPVADLDGVASPVEEQALQAGIQVMNKLLPQVLASKPGIRFVFPQVNTKEASPGNLEAARRIAQQHKCNMVLETTLSRYNERVGGDYGVKEAATVNFGYKLYEVNTGKVLCRGRFDEQQQSVMENLLVLSKAKSRGLTWLTVEDLARNGLQEKLGQCSYITGQQ